ncbi:peptidoglycan DD-metalloendopeptidase family protein [Desulfobacula sp.]
MNRFFDYLQTISQVNDLSCGLGNGRKIQWLFHCGMLFSSKVKWWGDFKFRQSAHEGIDIAYYRTHPDEMHCFNDSIKVPAMDDGIILNICDDFLGQTLVVEHKNLSSSNKRLLFAYAHIIPEKSLKTGLGIKKKDVIARVCDTYKNPQLSPHLHFSCFEISKKMARENLNWTLFSNNSDIHKINPVFL